MTSRRILFEECGEVVSGVPSDPDDSPPVRVFNVQVCLLKDENRATLGKENTWIIRDLKIFSQDPFDLTRKVLDQIQSNRSDTCRCDVVIMRRKDPRRPGDPKYVYAYRFLSSWNYADIAVPVGATNDQRAKYGVK